MGSRDGPNDEPPHHAVSESLQRVLTALVAAPLVLYLTYLGGWPFAVLVAAIGLLGQREFYAMAGQAGAQPQTLVGLLLGLLLVVGIARPRAWPVFAGAVLLFVVAAPFLLRQEQFVSSFAVTLAGIVYPTGLLGTLVWLREARGPVVDDMVAFELVLLVILLVWATDIAAYYVGKAVGTHALAPSISPNKTWEGTLGGLLAAIVVGVVFKIVLLDILPWSHLAVVVALGGGVSQMGDLLESSLKRSTHVKDSSHLLPGHGGMLDRFDAMTVAAPMICLYLDVVAGLF